MISNQRATICSQQRWRLRCFWLAIFVFLQASLSSARDREIAQQVDFQQRLGDSITLQNEFIDEEGQPVSLNKFFGDVPVILTLVYYECPMLCTLELNGLAKSLREVKLSPGEDFRVVTVSIDPGETPALAREKKENYLGRYGRPQAKDAWHFLTGEQANIEKLASEVGFGYAYDADRDEYAHSAGILMLSPEGQITRYFYGINYAATDLRLGLVESSQGKIGTPTDHLVLMCYGYDPATGKYGFLVMGAIRLFGAATVVALGVFVGVHWYRDWRNKGAK